MPDPQAWIPAAWLQATQTQVLLALAVLAVSAAVGLGLRWILRRHQLRVWADRQSEDTGAEDLREQVEGRAETAPAVDEEPPEPAVWVKQLPWFVALSLAVWGIDRLGLLPVAEVARLVRSGLEVKLVSFSGSTITAFSVLLVIGVLFAGWWVSGLVQRAIAATMRRQGAEDPGVIAVFQRLAHYGVLAIAFAIGLETAGVDLSTLFTAGAALAVGIGFGLQVIAKNFVSGIILLLERSIKPGDMLTVDGRVVRVRAMGIRATIARTMEDEDVIIPNATLVENAVVNHSFDTDVVRARAVVGVAYESDLDKVFEVLTRCAKDFQGRVKSNESVVLLKGFGASSIDFEVSVWVPSAFARPQALSKLRLAMWRALKEAELVIAFPQIDVHFDAEVVERLGSAPKAEAPRGDASKDDSPRDEA